MSTFILFPSIQIDNTRNNDLEKFEKGNIVQVQGRFSIIETNIYEEKIKMIKVK